MILLTGLGGNRRDRSLPIEPAAGRMVGRQADLLHLPGLVILAFTGPVYVAGARQLAAHGVVVNQTKPRTKIYWPLA